MGHVRPPQPRSPRVRLSPDSGHVAATQRTAASGQKQALTAWGCDAENLLGARPLRRLPYMLLEHQHIEPIDKDTMAATKIALRLLARERGRAERDAGF
jgi:hypothetical protein